MQIAIDRELAKRSFYEFVKMAWNVVEPSTQFLDNWHIESICERLQGILEEKYNPKLVINVPPGSMKTHITATFFPAWVWTIAPGKKFIYTTLKSKTTEKMVEAFLNVVNSNWYQERWGHIWKPSSLSWGKTNAGNNKSGSVKAFSVTSKIIGHHADFFFVDDPIDPKGTRSKVELETANRFFYDYVSTRLTNPNKSGRIIIMQRLSELDVAQTALNTNEYDHLCLPLHYDPDWDSPNYLKEYDKRSEKGEGLWPARFTPEFVESQRIQLGSTGFAAQYEQRPIPAEGGIFKVNWFNNYWKSIPDKATYIQSWDMAFKGTDQSDYVVCQIWAQSEGRFYLVDQLRKRMDFPETKAAMRFMHKKWNRATLKLVEDKANGPAIIDDLRREVPGLVAVKPRGSKQARAASVAPLWEAGNVYIPDPDQTGWVLDFIHECTVFDKGKHDDQVDAMTQALDRLQKRSISKIKKAIDGLYNLVR